MHDGFDTIDFFRFEFACIEPWLIMLWLRFDFSCITMIQAKSSDLPP